MEELNRLELTPLMHMDSSIPLQVLSTLQLCGGTGKPNSQKPTDSHYSNGAKKKKISRVQRKCSEVHKSNLTAQVLVRCVWPIVRGLKVFKSGNAASETGKIIWDQHIRDDLLLRRSEFIQHEPQAVVL